jgi:hypothetical protein
VAGVCTILFNRLARLLAFHSSDARIAAAARSDLECDVSLNTQYTTQEVRDLLEGLKKVDTTGKGNKRNKNKDKGKEKKDL